MIKILVVDDEIDLEHLFLQKFRKQIQASEYQFLFARNGLEALACVQADPEIKLMISDILMPEMDGLSLLETLHQSNPLIKVIMISAFGDMDNIRRAMNLGAFDFLTKPVDLQDLELTLRKTVEHIQQLDSTLKAIKENNILKLYVDEHVLQFMSSREYELSLIQNETIDATTMFVDICGFTQISESVAPNEVVTWLNTYFDLFTKSIIAHEGVVDKFMGDCVMAVFKGPGHITRAIQSAFSILQSIQHADVMQPLGNNQVAVSIGINTGEMISGNIGSATLKRLDYTVIGDTVNTAQRLQSVAGKNQIFISTPVFEQISYAYECRELGDMQLKNKRQAIKVYEVLAAKT